MTEVYAGLDISDKSTHVWVVDSSGGVIWSGACATDPAKRGHTPISAGRPDAQPSLASHRASGGTRAMWGAKNRCVSLITPSMIYWSDPLHRDTKIGDSSHQENGCPSRNDEDLAGSSSWPR